MGVCMHEKRTCMFYCCRMVRRTLPHHEHPKVFSHQRLQEKRFFSSFRRQLHKTYVSFSHLSEVTVGSSLAHWTVAGTTAATNAGSGSTIIPGRSSSKSKLSKNRTCQTNPFAHLPESNLMSRCNPFYEKQWYFFL